MESRLQRRKTVILEHVQEGLVSVEYTYSLSGIVKTQEEDLGILVRKTQLRKNVPVSTPRTQNQLIMNMVMWWSVRSNFGRNSRLDTFCFTVHTTHYSSDTRIDSAGIGSKLSLIHI